MICQSHLANYIYLFNRSDELSYRTNPPSIPTRVQDIKTEETSIVEGFLADFLIPILPKILEETAAE